MLKKIIQRIGRKDIDRGAWVPDGHFYSPVPDYTDIEKRAASIFKKKVDVPDIDLNSQHQLDLLALFSKYYPEQPFESEKNKKCRYYFENPNFSYADGLILYSMIRHYRPNRIIEIGGGFTTGLIQDVNSLFLNNRIQHTLIEPYPELAHTILGSEKYVCKIVEKKLQDIDTIIFEDLKENDIVFIDSSHVAKIGSDVNHIFFNILPRLAKGVLIHFHDIFFPFEYPMEWIHEGRVWSEIYLMRAFLSYNDSYSIEFFNDYMATFFEKELYDAMPLIQKNSGGSLWMRKIDGIN